MPEPFPIATVDAFAREFLPQCHAEARLTQYDCNSIARQLNNRPGKRLGYRTPEECYAR